jgi:hypothetical protein
MVEAGNFRTSTVVLVLADLKYDNMSILNNSREGGCTGHFWSNSGSAATPSAEALGSIPVNSNNNYDKDVTIRPRGELFVCFVAHFSLFCTLHR